MTWVLDNVPSNNVQKSLKLEVLQGDKKAWRRRGILDGNIKDFRTVGASEKKVVVVALKLSKQRRIGGRGRGKGISEGSCEDGALSPLHSNYQIYLRMVLRICSLFFMKKAYFFEKI
eukprot:jgi/Bigna1/85277/estExt_fgenesh1_pg.C_30130